MMLGALLKRQLKRPVEPDDDEANPLFVGYVRVSTDEQNEDMQAYALRRAGVHSENIHSDVGVSGAAARKPAREMALRQLRPGMTLVVWKLDRVSRDLLDLLTLLQDLDRNGIGFKSLQESIDTSTPMGKVMLAVLGAFAQFERDTARQRTIAGIALAKERGVQFGQPTKITPEVRTKVNAWFREGCSVSQIVKRLKVDGTKLAESTIRKHWKAKDIARARAGEEQ